MVLALGLVVGVVIVGVVVGPTPVGDTGRPAPPSGAEPPTGASGTSGPSEPSVSTEPSVPTADVPPEVPSAATCTEEVPDATAALQAWLDGLPSSDVVARLATGRCYRVEGTLEIVAKARFTLDGRGATLRAFTLGPDDRHGLRTRAHLSVSGSQAVTVIDLVVDGGDLSPGRVEDDEPSVGATEAQHGFRIDGATDPSDPRRGPNQDITLTGVVADRVRGDGVYVRASSDVVVRDARLGSSGGPEPGGLGRHGVAVVSGTDVVVESSVVANAANATLDIEPNLEHDAIAGVTFRDNEVVQGPDGPPGLTFVANGGAAAPIEEVAIVGNRLRGKPLWLVSSPPHPDGYPYSGDWPGAVAPDPGDPSTYTRRGYRIEGNVSDTPTFRSGSPAADRGAAIFVGGVDGLRVVGNVVPVGSDRFPAEPMALVHLRDVLGAVVADNDVPASDGDGSGDAVVDHEGPAPCGSGNRVGSPLVVAAGPVPC